MAETTYLLWFDIETTGLDINEDEIIEVGAILTTTDLEELNQTHRIIQPSEDGYSRLLRTAAVRRMHDANGLLDEIERTAPLHPAQRRNRLEQVDLGLAAWLERADLDPDRRFVMAGSGVGPFDRPWVRKHMPHLDAMLHYAVLDVGVLRRANEFWWEHDDAPTRPEGLVGHRALDDARAALEEARHWKRVLGGGY